MTSKNGLPLGIEDLVERSGVEPHLQTLAEVAPEHFGHSVRTAGMAYAGMSAIRSYAEWMRIATGFAGLAHDLGKANHTVYPFVNSERTLTSGQKAIVRGHTRYSKDILDTLGDKIADGSDSQILKLSLELAANIAELHHNPLSPQTDGALAIVVVADRIDAMCSERPHLKQTGENPSKIQDVRLGNILFPHERHANFTFGGFKPDIVLDAMKLHASSQSYYPAA